MLTKHLQFLKQQFRIPVIHTGDLNVTATNDDTNLRRPFLEEYPGHKSWERNAFAQRNEEAGFVDVWTFFPEPY